MFLVFNSNTGLHDPALSHSDEVSDEVAHVNAARRVTAPAEQRGKRARSSRTRAAKSARALFIDFDGVLHPLVPTPLEEPSAPLVSTGHFGWLPTLVEVLRKHSDVAIVVHSTWRYTHDVEELRLLLGALGPRVVGATPKGPRFESIQWWLHMNPQFVNHRILDDDAREFPTPPPPELVLCDPRTGVTAPTVLAALRNWLEE